MRRKPYTAAGIRRCKCMRCGDAAVHQWSACAVGNKNMPLCLKCDIKLNRVALNFVLGTAKAKPFMDRYERKHR